MRVLREGHRYICQNFEGKDEGQTIQFIEKCRVVDLDENQKQGRSFSLNQETDLITINDGTTNEEVLEMLIDRMNYLQSKFPCRENALVITKLEESLMWLNKRTQDRVKRNVEGKHLK